jgi:DNA-binding XRE family transcriptional regulator
MGRKWSDVKAELRERPGAERAYEDARRAYELGCSVRELRRARGLSQAQLGAMIGTTQTAIARIEGGGADTKLRTLCRLAEALDARAVVTGRDVRLEAIPITSPGSAADGRALTA